MGREGQEVRFNRFESGQKYVQGAAPDEDRFASMQEVFVSTAAAVWTAKATVVIGEGRGRGARGTFQLISIWTEVFILTLAAEAEARVVIEGEGGQEVHLKQFEIY